MELFYIAVFALSALATGALEGTRKTETGSAVGNREFLRFRNNYVLVYALMMGKGCTACDAVQVSAFVKLTTLCSWGLASRPLCVCIVPVLRL